MNAEIIGHQIEEVTVNGVIKEFAPAAFVKDREGFGRELVKGSDRREFDLWRLWDNCL